MQAGECYQSFWNTFFVTSEKAREMGSSISLSPETSKTALSALLYTHVQVFNKSVSL